MFPLDNRDCCNKYNIFCKKGKSSNILLRYIYSVVFNVFEDETYGDKYESGKTYTYTVKEGELINFSFDVGLKEENSKYIKNYNTIVINKDGKIEYE